MSQLHARDGTRKYLTRAEREAFLAAATDEERERRTFCEMLVYSGARLSEVVSLTTRNIDLKNHAVIIESLKKRKRGIYRSVPLPDDFMERLDLVHGIRRHQQRGKAPARLWTFQRTTAWHIVKEVMRRAGIPNASPKSLRHGFGVAAVTSSVPLNMVQKWLGHSNIANTAIYANALGEEERQIAARMWQKA
jgi:integrase/recombinase XerD